MPNQIIRNFIAIPIEKLWVYKLRGINNIPRDEPFILASNHISMLDGVVLSSIILHYINKKLHFYVKGKYFEKFILRLFLKLGECIPVFVGVQKNSKLNKRAYKKAIRYLKKNEPVGIFPEGAISFDLKLNKARRGLGRLVLGSNTKVLPVCILSRSKILGSKKICPHFRSYDIRIGKSIELKNQGLNQEEKIKYIGNKVMKKIKILMKSR